MPVIVDTVKSEMQSNAAFRNTVIGALFLYVALIVFVITIFRTLSYQVARHLILPILGAFAVLAYILCMDVYTNYCLVHGKCNAFALFEGTTLLVVGILAFIYSIFVLVLKPPMQPMQPMRYGY